MYKIDEVCHCIVSGAMSMAHLLRPGEIQVIILEESMGSGKVVPLYEVTKIVTLSLIGIQVQVKFIYFCSDFNIFTDG